MQRYRAVAVPGLPRFSGGAVGFIGYEFIHDIEPVVPRPAQDDLNTPVMYFLIADELLIFDRVAQTITILVSAVLDGKSSAEEAYEDAVAEVDRLVSLLEQPCEHFPVDVPQDVPQIPFESNVPKETFSGKRIPRQKIHYRRRHYPGRWLTALFYAGPRCAAGHLSRGPFHQPFALHVFAGTGGVCAGRRFAGNSCALRKPPGGNPAHRRDASCAAKTRRKRAMRRWRKSCWLIPSERAEHVMLVDLARNDLGRVCDYGSVQVKDLMTIERYSHVMHIVSQVEGTLSANRKPPMTLMRATFPAWLYIEAGACRRFAPCRSFQELEQTGARALRRLRRIFFLQRLKSRLLHHHSHGADQRRPGLGAGRRRMGQ